MSDYLTSDEAMMCTAKDCNDKASAKGLCDKHYMRLRRTGDVNSARKRSAMIATNIVVGERFGRLTVVERAG